VPGLHRLAILFDPDNPVNPEEVRQVHTAADRLSLEVSDVAIRRAGDIAPAFERIKERADALYVVATPLAFTNMVGINTLAASARLPTIFAPKEHVEGWAAGLRSKFRGHLPARRRLCR
jgi:putative ABC transport system substrate-binding protein